jgi:putative oxidoreductase
VRIVEIVARYLLGIIFTVFGLNGFLNFIHQPPPPNPLASQFFIAISASHFSVFFFAVQLIAGLLLLSGYFVPLALVLLAAEIFNILAFHFTMAPATVGPGILAAVLWVLVFLQHRPSFDGILSAKQSNQVGTK